VTIVLRSKHYSMSSADPTYLCGDSRRTAGHTAGNWRRNAVYQIDFGAVDEYRAGEGEAGFPGQERRHQGVWAPMARWLRGMSLGIRCPLPPTRAQPCRPGSSPGNMLLDGAAKQKISPLRPRGTGNQDNRAAGMSRPARCRTRLVARPSGPVSELNLRRGQSRSHPPTA
jgi:hypothetical protein